MSPGAKLYYDYLAQQLFDQEVAITPADKLYSLNKPQFRRVAERVLTFADLRAVKQQEIQDLEKNLELSNL